MDDLLHSWGLDDVIPAFAENEITIDSLGQLTESMIKELIPKVGKRIVFLSKLKEYKKEIEKRQEEKSPDQINEDWLKDATVVVLEDNDAVQTPRQSLSSPASTCNSNEEVESTVAVPFNIVPLINNQVAFCGIEDLLSQDNRMPDFDLKTLLKVSPYGDSILKYYDSKDALNEYLRNKLVDIIVRHIYSYIMKYRLTHAQYNILCSKILVVFPNECVTTYYKAGQRNKNRIVQPRGKLVDKIRNILYKSPDKVYVRKRKSSSTSTDQPTPKIINEEETIAMTWLKYNREPWDEVLTRWKLTHNVRQNHDTKTVAEFIETWPAIEDPRAHSLIEADFGILFPGKELNFCTKWTAFFETILELKKGCLTDKDPILKELLTYLEDSENISQDSKVAIYLSALPRIIPPKGRLIQAKQQWKFSAIECAEALIVHCKVAGDIEQTIANIKEKSNKRKIFQHVQPYLIVVGNSLRDISHAYIIINTIRYHFTSVIRAFDILFKIFFALNIAYPPQAEHIYILIQKGIFKINSEKDKALPYIEDVLKALANI